MKKLIVYVCSISYGLNAEKDQIWAQRLADDLGLELINLSICGAGNIVNANKILNTDIEFFKDSVVIFQTTYFERQTLRKYLTNPYYNVSEIEKDCNSYDKETFEIDIAKLTINDWVGYWAPLPPNRWEYHTKFEYSKWIKYLKSMFIQNSIFLHSAHTFLKQHNIPHMFFDIPVPVMSYKCNFKDWTPNNNTRDGFHAEGAKHYFTDTRNESFNSFYKFFMDENFTLIDLISNENKITDVVIESIYGNNTAIWKEDKFLMKQNKGQLGKPDGAHPSEKGHELIYLCLKDKFKEKGFLYF